MLNEGIMSRSSAWWYYVDSSCRPNSLSCGRRRATALGWNKLYPVANVPAPWCALQAVHVRGQPALLSMRWLCGAKAGRRIRSAKVFFQGSYGKCDGLVSQSAACQHGGGIGKHPGKGDLCGLPTAAPQLQGLGGRRHLLPFGTTRLWEHRACYCPRPWRKELAACPLGCCLRQEIGAGGPWW